MGTSHFSVIARGQIRKPYSWSKRIFLLILFVMFKIMFIKKILIPVLDGGDHGEGAAGLSGDGDLTRAPLRFDPSRESKRPWPESLSQNCSEFLTRFLTFGSRPGVVPLSAVPGSGSIWVRQLLEGMTGAFTGDVAWVRSLITDSPWWYLVRTTCCSMS